MGHGFLGPSLRGFDLVGLGRDLRHDGSNKLPGDVDVTGSQMILGETPSIQPAGDISRERERQIYIVGYKLCCSHVMFV